MVDQWEVILWTEVEDWYLDLCAQDPDTAGKVEQAIEMLAEEGPTLGRPYVDKIAGSKHHNLKELRPTRSDTHIRILFIFDPLRQAILLLAGDKAGDWKGWYQMNVPIAEQRYEAWCEQLREEQSHD